MEQTEDESTSDNDVCVGCGAVTKYKKSDHVDTRMGYIEGAGQLCPRCNYNETFIKGRNG
jgi:hypothetical protein|tara:strand:- start:1143 stop:1322 length:180 start_codon:yes stop_codon:yes gene_type:complete